MSAVLRCLAILICLAGAFPLSAQESDVADAMQVYKQDAGNWDCEFKMYPSPDAEPMVSKASETNVMLGDTWLISHFKGEIEGMEMQGSGQFGYNPETKKYIGSWVDSMSPYPMCIEGTWNEATKTMTCFGTGKDPTGAESKSKLVTVYKDHDNHTMTMFMETGKDQWMKVMEIVYKRRK